MGRINAVLNEKAEIEDSPDAKEITEFFTGSIEFSNISFRYSEELPYVLKGINLKIGANEQLGIIGRTGEGKTTLVNLIPRVFEPEKGKVLIDGRDVRDYRLKDIRRRIGFVPQDSFLFSLSLKENICFGKPDISMEKIIKAARIAQIYDEIMMLPDGFDTVIGERGVSLSGGQKQRVAIARALVLDPNILILDDALSSVDTETETKITEELIPFMQQRTTIIITHRIPSIKDIKRIIVFGDGNIKEDGNHSELLALGGIYKKLYEKQILLAKLEGFD